MITMKNSQLMARLAGVHHLGWVTPEEGEWPKRDAVPNVAWDCVMANSNPGLIGLLNTSEIPVTPEMIAAAVTTDKAMPSPLPDEADYFAPIYRAMAALAPVELVSAGELAALRERDGLQREVADLRCRLAERDASALKALRHRV